METKKQIRSMPYVKKSYTKKDCVGREVLRIQEE